MRQGAGGGATSGARTALYEATPFVCMVAAYVASGVLLFPKLGREIPFTFTEFYPTPVLLTGLYLAGTFLLAMLMDVFLARRRPGDPETWRILFRRWFGARRLVGTLIVLAVLPALLDVMIGYRLALTEIKPFAYDMVFASLDRALHFGHQPWELLQPLVGRPAITAFIDGVYVFGWFGLLWTGVIWQTVHGRPTIRLQFLLSFAVAWIALGTAAAIAFSSAGPVYYARVTGLADPYALLFDYLYKVNELTPLHAIVNQENLWISYLTWGGITAMPSMHLTIATVVSLAAVRTARRLALVIAPLWGLLLIGSIHLGWHYAIDSYAGILGAVLIWWMAGGFARWWIGRGGFAGAAT